MSDPECRISLARLNPVTVFFQLDFHRVFWFNTSIRYKLFNLEFHFENVTFHNASLFVMNPISFVSEMMDFYSITHKDKRNIVSMITANTDTLIHR